VFCFLPFDIAPVTFVTYLKNMKHSFILLLVLLLTTQSKSQYYFNDFIANKQSNSQHQLLKTNGIRKVKIINNEADNTVQDGFKLEQEINKDWSEVITTSSSSVGSSTLISNYTKSGVIKTVEVSNGVSNTLDYVYYENGLLQKLTSNTIDTSFKRNSTESHEWFYTSNLLPLKMLKIKNNSDTTIVIFVTDEKGLVTEEQWSRKGKNTESYFYYYNDQNNISDIVRYNSKVKKMLPDFIYEYNENGSIKQMIQVLAGGSNYNTWVYTYLTNGLKEKEFCYDKQKKLVGAVEYIYNK
jgi:hypothetical protein